jgi:hypothetical protein
MTFILFTTIYNYYYLLKTYLYLRKQNPDLIYHLIGSDLPVIKRMFNRRLSKWYSTNTNGEDEVIKQYKNKLRISSSLIIKLIKLLVILVLIVVILKSFI